METLFVGNHTIHLPEVTSTNSYANALLKDVKAPEGTLIWADHQTAGKGMRGNVWQAESRANITASYIFYPAFLNASNHFLLSKMVALALFDTLTELLNPANYDIKIKWPNDILVNGKKIAGVLIENSFREDKINSAVIGIGLNLNQEDFGELENKATSLYLLTKTQFPREDVLKKISKNLEVVYLQLKGEKKNQIKQRYLSTMLGFNTDLRFLKTADQSYFNGRIEGVEDDGKILIQLFSGEVKAFEMKEISFGY